MGRFSYDRYGETRCYQRRRFESGAALLVAMVSLMVIALGAIYVTAEQSLAQHQMLSLELRRLERQKITEELFESMVLDVATTNEGVVWNRALLNSMGVNNELSAMREPLECPHPFATTSSCALLRVQQGGTGFMRERVLITPTSDCSTPYWYAPDFKVGGITTPTPPRGEPVRPDKPKQPPRTLPYGI